MKRWTPTSTYWHWLSWRWGWGEMLGPRMTLDHVSISHVGLSTGWKVTTLRATFSCGPVTLIFGNRTR